MLDDLFEAACANSGFAYLQFVANSGAIKEERDRHRKAAACLLVGPLRPLRFRIALAFGNVRRALFELLDEVTDLGDGSLAFELNTPSIAWWRERRDHFHFDVLMMMGALFVALATQALLIDVTTRWTAVAANLGPATLSLSYLLLWLFCCAVVYWCMRGLWRIHLAAAVVRVNLSRHLQQSEWPRVVPALLAIAATQLSYASESLLSIFAFTFSFCLLAWLYRLWVFVFLAGGLLTYVGYEIRLEPGAHKELSIILVTANQVLLHAGIVICVLLVRPHDRTHRDRQSETETVNDSRLDSAQVALLLMLALGSGYAVLPLLR